MVWLNYWMNFSEIWPLFIISVNKKSTPASLLLKIKIHYSDKKNQNRRTIKNDDFKFWLLEFFFYRKVDHISTIKIFEIWKQRQKAIRKINFKICSREKQSMFHWTNFFHSNIINGLNEFSHRFVGNFSQIYWEFFMFK